MTLLEFLLTSIIICVLVYLAITILHVLVPTLPPIVPQLLWGVAVLLILLLLLKALGVGLPLSDPTIPRVK